jgi:hypothetical protein
VFPESQEEGGGLELSVKERRGQAGMWPAPSLLRPVHATILYTVTWPKGLFGWYLREWFVHLKKL